MFTKATQNFGNWRSDHRSAGEPNPMANMSLLVALGACAFVCWIVFFVSLKIRSEFFVIENQKIELHKIASFGQAFSKERPAALKLGVVPSGSEELMLFFESGEVFKFPAEQQKIANHIQKRINEMMLTGLLTLIASPAISRVQLWPDVKTSDSDLQSLTNYLVNLGFDDFDIAFEME